MTKLHPWKLVIVVTLVATLLVPGSTPPRPLQAASQTWSNTGSLAAARYGHTATLLPNGKVLAAGGLSGSDPLIGAELYDPATGTWSATGSLNTARYASSATLLSNGQVLVVGG